MLSLVVLTYYASYSQQENKFSKWLPLVLCMFSFVFWMMAIFLSDNHQSNFSKTIICLRGLVNIWVMNIA